MRRSAEQAVTDRKGYTQDKDKKGVKQVPVNIKVELM